MSWAINGHGHEMGRIVAITVVAEQTGRYKDAFRWLHNHRPSAITHAAMQKVYGIVDAAMSVLKNPRASDSSGYDYLSRLRDIRALCADSTGHLN